nr:EOG090X07S9 [Ilyocryptus agilis]
MQEQNIPIDIQTSKLLDWVINRRHCSKLWPQQITLVREKINLAIRDMPEHKGVTKLLSGTYINYYHCLQIVEILKETEADTRSMFGRYGSQRMKDWQEVVKLYEKDNVYLAESSQMLMRNVTYEIPGLKKSIMKCEQIQQDCDKREAECAKNAKDFREKYKSHCTQMGIEGKDIKKELTELLSCLPEMYNEVASGARKLKEACALYRSFVRQLNSLDGKFECLPVLQHIIEHGNTTVYEWRYGEPPLKIEEAPVFIELEAPATSDDAIDFGDAVIDFGSGEVELETGDIDWGQIDMLPDAHEATVDFSSADDATVDIVVQSAGVEGGVAKDNEALTMLDYHKTRNMFVDDIMELNAFLRQRLIEMQSTSSQSQTSFSLSQVHSSAEFSVEQLENMLSLTISAADAINRPKLKNLALIRESPRYVDRVATALQQHLKLADKMEANRVATAEKRRAAAAEQGRLQPLVKRLIERTKELQADIEQSISRKYNNRPVHITGGVTTI